MEDVLLVYNVGVFSALVSSHFYHFYLNFEDNLKIFSSMALLVNLALRPVVNQAGKGTGLL